MPAPAIGPANGGGEYTTREDRGRTTVDHAPAASYSGSVQQVFLFSGLAVLIGGLGVIAARWTFGVGSAGKRLVLGIIPGLAGAIVVGVWQLDLIPDQVEAALLPLVLTAGTFAMGLLVLVELRAR
jgi:hypothetical protein